MKKIFIIALMALALSGCAGLDTFFAIAEIAFPPPRPICDQDSAGTVWQGKVCLKYSSSDFRWEAIKEGGMK